MTLLPANWEPAPAQSRCGEREIHVWRALLTQPKGVLSRLERTLSGDERARAEKFAFDHLRDRFVVGRAVLRQVLSSYLDEDSRQLRFQYGRHGKPSLKGDSTWQSFGFNFSQSQDLALVAVAWNRDIGVDVEWIRSDVDQTELAARFFSAGESAKLGQLPPDKQVDSFFTYWTCKEAYIKAKGGGLSIPLDGFEVKLVAGEATANIVGSEDSQEEPSWWVHQLNAGPGYASAVAVDSQDLGLALWDWSADWRSPVGHEGKSC